MNKAFCMKKILFLLFTHSFVLAIGFGLGVYFLPILTAPKSIEISKINEYENKSLYQTEFVKDLRGVILFIGVKQK